MDDKEFVSAIVEVVREASIEDVFNTIASPPAYATKKASFPELRQWYQTLSATEQNYIRTIIEEAADATIFGFFCVIDGVRTIEGPGEKGTLTLSYSKQGTTIAINKRDGEMLHDLFQTAVGDR